MLMGKNMIKLLTEILNKEYEVDYAGTQKRRQNHVYKLPRNYAVQCTLQSIRKYSRTAFEKCSSNGTISK